MIRVERDPEWWYDVASDPGVVPMLAGGDPQAVGNAVLNPAVLPLAADNGGFFFVNLDSLGLVMEFHTLFRPEGWGREVHRAGKEALEFVFQVAQVVTTYEVEDNPRSQPPRTFGFVRGGDFRPAPANPGFMVRSWVLTRIAWEDSPAYRSFKRMRCQ